MLGDALTKVKAGATDLLRACVRASVYQLADESSTLQRTREEREARSFAKADGEIRRTADANVSVVPTESSTTAAQGSMRVRFPAEAVLSDLPLKQVKAQVTLQLVVNTRNIQIMTVASLEDRVLRTLVDLERLCKMDLWRIET